MHYEKGNWCEGITVYMADHLIKEQRGQGSDYRRTTLQKFTDYVNETNDFPVVEFRSRHNAAEEAIGYGKATMFNHMLRKKFGDEKFIKAYQDFYAENKFKIQGKSGNNTCSLALMKSKKENRNEKDFEVLLAWPADFCAGRTDYLHNCLCVHEHG